MSLESFLKSAISGLAASNKAASAPCSSKNSEKAAHTCAPGSQGPEAEPIRIPPPSRLSRPPELGLRGEVNQLPRSSFTPAPKIPPSSVSGPGPTSNPFAMPVDGKVGDQAAYRSLVEGGTGLSIIYMPVLTNGFHGFRHLPITAGSSVPSLTALNSFPEALQSSFPVQGVSVGCSLGLPHSTGFGLLPHAHPAEAAPVSLASGGNAGSYTTFESLRRGEDKQKLREGSRLSQLRRRPTLQSMTGSQWTERGQHTGSIERTMWNDAAKDFEHFYSWLELSELQPRLPCSAESIWCLLKYHSEPMRSLYIEQMELQPWQTLAHLDGILASPHASIMPRAFRTLCLAQLPREISSSELFLEISRAYFDGVTDAHICREGVESERSKCFGFLRFKDVGAAEKCFFAVSHLGVSWWRKNGIRKMFLECSWARCPSKAGEINHTGYWVEAERSFHRRLLPWELSEFALNYVDFEDVTRIHAYLDMYGPTLQKTEDEVETGVEGTVEEAAESASTAVVQ